MAISTIRKYRHGMHVLPSGQKIELPGGGVFTMVHGFPPQIDIYTIDTIQRWPLGTFLQRGDRKYRYVEFGGATAAGDYIQMEVPDAAHDLLDPTGTGTGAAVTAGATLLSIADTITLVVDEYAGGVLSIEENTGAGYLYDIEANDAPASNALVQIKDGLAIALDSTSNVTLTKSKYKEVLQMVAAPTAAVVGTSVGVGADGSFGWMQTSGPAAVLTSGSFIIGEHVRAGDATAGSAEPLNRDGTDEDEQELGYVVKVAATGLWSVVNIGFE